METQASRQQQIAMLKILYGACSVALDSFRAADGPMDASSSRSSRRWSNAHASS
jgi:hypothetical protein